MHPLPIPSLPPNTSSVDPAPLKPPPSVSMNIIEILKKDETKKENAEESDDVVIVNNFKQEKIPPNEDIQLAIAFAEAIQGSTIRDKTNVVMAIYKAFSCGPIISVVGAEDFKSIHFERIDGDETVSPLDLKKLKKIVEILQKQTGQTMEQPIKCMVCQYRNAVVQDKLNIVCDVCSYNMKIYRERYG